MTRYAVLLPGDESGWERATAREREEAYARHAEFARQLAARGHRITGGAELAHSRDTKVVRRGAGTRVVTDGPYAETVEQLTGFYLVDTDHLEDLLDVIAVLVDPADGPSGPRAVEVRRCVDPPAEPGQGTT